jgi:hypothetical protein
VDRSLFSNSILLAGYFSIFVRCGQVSPWSIVAVAKYRGSKAWSSDSWSSDAWSIDAVAKCQCHFCLMKSKAHSTDGHIDPVSTNKELHLQVRQNWRMLQNGGDYESRDYLARGYPARDYPARILAQITSNYPGSN